MTSLVLETARAAHERLERLELAAVADIMEKPKRHVERVQQEHRLLQRADEIVETSKQLLKIYDDEDGSRRDELNALAPGSNERVFEAFYDRLKDIRAYYRKFPELGAAIEGPVQLDPPKPHIAFSGEEVDGRYLDLHELHDQYLNLKMFPSVDYLAYLDAFYKFQDAPRDRKSSTEYHNYLQNLLGYLLSYYHRALPLENIESVLTRVEKEFQQQEDHQQQHKGGDHHPPAPAASSAPALAAAAASSTASNNAAAGNGSAGAAAGGGGGETWCEACRKSFKATVYNAHLTGKKHLKAEKELQAGHSSRRHAIAAAELLERKITAVAEYLQLTIEDTKRNIEKKQSMTVDEILAGIEAAENGQDEELLEEDQSDEELDAKIWNPKGLPLDVTGKPIPYWLWKLHGLGVEYQCEICGNYSYWGIYAFEKHFQEWRHQNAMKILGIPNTKHFHNVTTINEALALHAKLKEETKKSVWRPDTEEEYEDPEGNVIPKKTYEDLVRQGIIPG